MNHIQSQEAPEADKAQLEGLGRGGCSTRHTLRGWGGMGVGWGGGGLGYGGPTGEYRGPLLGDKTTSRGLEWSLGLGRWLLGLGRWVPQTTDGVQ